MDGSSSRPGPRDRRTTRNVEDLQLTDEERKVLRECRMNSLVRGVPAGILSTLLTSFVVKSGRFPHLTHWSRFYYGASFTGGLLIGVASYRKTCLEKIMNLENSVLADQVREYYRRSGLEYTGPLPQRKVTEFNDSAIDHDEPVPSSTKENIPYLRRSVGEEESKFPSLNDWENKRADEPKHNRFEELRKQNRQKWNQDHYPVRRRQPWDLSKGDKQEGQDDQNRQTQGSSGVIRRNIYGDPIE